jgi:hypothetical protein
MVNTCSFCGEVFDTLKYNEGSIRTIMTDNNACFNCAFWIEKVNVHDENVFITPDLQRRHGSVINKNVVKGFIGSGGRNFFVKYNDGRVMVYNNVWFQGDVPDFLFKWERFNCLKPNATIISEEEYLEYVMEQLLSLNDGECFKSFTRSGENLILVNDKEKQQLYPYKDDKFVYKPIAYQDVFGFETILNDFITEDYLIEDTFGNIKSLKEWRNRV